MKIQVSVNLNASTLQALDQLATLEAQSRSGMAAMLIRQKLEELRQEYCIDPTLSSLPKTPKTCARRWDAECIEKFGK